MLDNYNTIGGVYVIGVPKIIGQSLPKAEKLILAEIDKIKNGEFSDELLEAIKLSMKKDHEQSIESMRRRSYMLIDAFATNKTWDEILNYPDEIDKVSKEDIQKVATKYLGENYLAFYTKTGFKKKKKIQKPPFKPIIPKNSEKKSAYAKTIGEMPVTDVEARFIEFNKDVNITEIKKNVHLYASKNPINDIFSLNIRYRIGTSTKPILEPVADILQYCGTKTHNLSDFKKELQKIGAEFYAYSSDDYFVLNITGLEHKTIETLKLINMLLTETVVDSKKIKKIAENKKLDIKTMLKDPQSIGDALSEYAMYKNKSEYLVSFSDSDIKKLSTEQLIKEFHNITDYEAEIHYARKKNTDEISRLIIDNLTISGKNEGIIYEQERVHYTKPIVYFIDNKKAIQSNIFFHVEGEKMNETDRTFSTAFNKYFGSGMGSIVFQEIREFRSLAYSSRGYYSSPLYNGKSGMLKAYLGTQADKTNEAVEIFLELIQNMPEKSGRIDEIKSALTQSINSNRPSFRYLSYSVAHWLKQSYKDDPRKQRIEQYKTMNFDVITDFYKKHIKGKPIIITVVGDKKRIDIEKLKKYGKFIELKTSDVINK